MKSHAAIKSVFLVEAKDSPITERELNGSTGRRRVRGTRRSRVARVFGRSAGKLQSGLPGGFSPANPFR
jgi:hypothetical protein